MVCTSWNIGRHLLPLQIPLSRFLRVRAKLNALFPSCVFFRKSKSGEFAIASIAVAVGGAFCNSYKVAGAVCGSAARPIGF
jgi:hypothetical protein